MIRTEELDVSYGTKPVLEAISIAVKEGSFIGILGPNGCGKTTLLRALSRIIDPDAGSVYVGDREIDGYSIRELATIVGAVPQETAVTFDFTVEEIVQMGRHPYLGRLSSMSEEDYAICRHAMEITNTAYLAGSLITEISGGERQRVLIARALAQTPRVLLLDEPTSHLDINHQIEVLSIIRGLVPEVTVIGVFHDINLAAYFCDTVVLMERAHIAAVGTPAAVITDRNIREIFGVDMIVRTHPITGRPYVVPRYDSGPPVDHPLRVHVVCGGGTGGETLYALRAAGHEVTAGVLSANDSDCTAAEGLGIRVIREPPFAPISHHSLEEYSAILSASDAVIVTGMSVGPGNIDNLRELKCHARPRIFLLSSDGTGGADQDYTGGEATAILDGLLENGAERIGSVPDLVNRLAALRADPA
nr:ABC transporter ATP-binding protein [Methanofollis fontis]